jgi:hypothetical protein
MNIKQALKKKNSLTGLITEQFQRANSYNSVEEGNPRPYSATDSIRNWFDLSNQLIELKTKIHLANAPVYDKIFELSELKNQVKYLKSLNCTAGVERNRWDSEKPIVKHAEINVVERDNMVKELEQRIEDIQNELDYHNQNTEI